MINPADLAFNGEEIKAVSEAVFESGFSKPALNKFHTVVNGIVAKKQIVILGRISGLVGLGSGGCSPTNATNTITNSNKFWNPVTVSDRLPNCWTTLQGTFFSWGLSVGIAKADLTATDFLNFVAMRLEDAILEAIYRIAWFSDTAVAVTTATPAGVLTTGTNLGYFNKMNGLWKQAYAIVAGNALRLTAGLGTKNAATTFALQAFNATDTTNRVVTTTLQNMKFDSDSRLRGAENVTMICTQSVADQYERELIAAGLPFTTERLENGILELKSGGITLVSFEFWDRIIRQYYSNGTKYFLPHRVAMYSVPNVQIGTAEEGAMAELDVIYDKVSKFTFLDFAFNIDAQIIESHMIQLAY